MAVNGTGPRRPRAQASATMQLYRWAELQVANVPDGQRLKISDLVEQADQEFATDPEWTRAFVSEVMPDMLRSVVQKSVAATRGHYKKYIFDGVVMGARQYAQQTTAEAATLQMKLMQKWGSWEEHSGASHIRLLDMTRADLLQAAEERERRANHELEIATLWREMAAAMDDVQTVRQAFDLRQIEEMSVAIRKARGTFIDPNITPASMTQASDSDTDGDQADDEDTGEQR